MALGAHPAAADDALSCLGAACRAAAAGSGDAAARVLDRRGELLTFRLTGPRAHATLVEALARAVAPGSFEWRTLAALPTLEPLPDGVAVAVALDPDRLLGGRVPGGRRRRSGGGRR